MEQFEMADKLAEMTGVSYAEAKEALESCSWNMLDALLLLEREGRIPKRSSEYKSAASDRTEETYRQDTDDEALPQPRHLGLKGVLKSIWNFLTLNTIVIRNNSGRVILSLPVLLAAIFMLASFWTLLVLVFVSFIFGCQYTFEGPQLGKKVINNAARQVGDKVHEFGQNFKEKHIHRKDASNGGR